MKRILFVILSLFFLYSCSNNNEKIDGLKNIIAGDENEIENTAKVLVQGLRMREHPTLKSKSIVSIPEDSVVTLLGEKTDYSEKITLRGLEYNEPWYLVSFSKYEGWVYGGGISLRETPKLSNVFPKPDKLYYAGYETTAFQEYVEENFSKHNVKEIETMGAEAYTATFRRSGSNIKINMKKEIFGLSNSTEYVIKSSSVVKVFELLQQIYPELDRFSLADGYKSIEEKQFMEGRAFYVDYVFEVIKDNTGKFREIEYKVSSDGNLMSQLTIHKEQNTVIVKERIVHGT